MERQKKLTLAPTNELEILKYKRTRDRLRRLLERYNRRFWRGKLRGVRIYNSSLMQRKRLMGAYNPVLREIQIDVKVHISDRQVRSTVLHEMCHAAVAANSDEHGREFWAEVEKLLRQKAPINIGPWGAPSLEALTKTMPRCFPLARRAVARAKARIGRVRLRPSRSCIHGTSGLAGSKAART